MSDLTIFQRVSAVVQGGDPKPAIRTPEKPAELTNPSTPAALVNNLGNSSTPPSNLLEQPMQQSTPHVPSSTNNKFSFSQLGKISVEQAVGFISNAGIALAEAALDLNGGHRKSRHLCLMGVERALEAVSGIIQWSYSQSTARAVDALKFLKSDPQFLQVRGSGPDGMLTTAEMGEIQNVTGAIVYYKNPYNPRKAGHICITTGDGGAVSDFKQKGIQVYSKPVSGYYVFLPLDRSASSGS